MKNATIILTLTVILILTMLGGGAKPIVTNWGYTSEGVQTHSIAVGACGAIWIDVCQECRTQGTEWVQISSLTCDVE